MNGLPDGGDQQWAALVPELSCSDLSVTLKFYCEALGFSVRYTRPGFAYLDLGAAQLMLEQMNGEWRTGPMESPFGRGINLQIEVSDVAALAGQVVSRGASLFDPPHTRWYRQGDIEHGQLEFLVQDPDGYLLRFCQSIGARNADLRLD